MNKEIENKADAILTYLMLFGEIDILLVATKNETSIKTVLRSAALHIAVLKYYFITREMYEEADECVEIEKRLINTFDEFEIKDIKDIEDFFEFDFTVEKNTNIIINNLFKIVLESK